MKITTVIEHDNSYLVNGVSSVPKNLLKNRDYRAVIAWLAIDGNNLTKEIQGDKKNKNKIKKDNSDNPLAELFNI